MNNEQFRRLLINNTQNKDGAAGSPPASSSSSAPSSKTPALGSRKHSSVGMTPRHVVGRNTASSEFARQLAQRNGNANPVKKWKSSAPKGVKLAKGYIDRTKERKDEEGDERVQRIKALEEAMKLGQIDRATFENLVQEITGGDIESTHLVRGLDRKLLERLRNGEDVQAVKSPDAESGSGDNAEEDDDDDDELDALEQQEVVPVTREKTDKKGEKAPPKPVAGAKRSRNALLAELKAQRQAAAEVAAAEHEKKYPSLGANFRRVGLEKTRIEKDSRGREVLIITDADGNEKRMVRKKKTEQAPLEIRHDIDDPNKPVKIPDFPKPEENSDDDDIFAGVGSNFNPLADVDGSDESSSEDEDGEAKEKDLSKPTEQKSEAEEDEPFAEEKELLAKSQPPPKPIRRNYFNEPTTKPSDQSNAANETVLAALRKVRTLDADSSLLLTEEEARLKKRAAMLAQDRDLEDLDMGFGSSRFDDAEEMEKEGEKIKLAEWKGLGAQDDDEEDGQNGPSAKKRKRGSKKRKGDKNSAADVLKVMERQKGSKPLG